ncbi:MAG: leucine-rich repeat protein, partial [Oscillospiraceae bacterium]|nr:leucine-rich repeat protein [Oscillospiraceae bacterium]
MKIRKALLSCLLVLATALVCLLALPTEAQAATAGTTGDCSWSLNGTTLTISGQGRMKNYSDDDDLPWGYDIQNVIIQEGVTSIGKYAFSWCRELRQVTIPQSVTSLSTSCFEGCSSLTSIDLSNFSSIPTDAFYGCAALKDIRFGNNITSIGTRAFYECDSLENVKIPEGTMGVGSFAFAHCSKLASVTIPSSVNGISEYAFYNCTKLAEMVFDGDVYSIGEGAFENTLWYNNLPAGVIYIGKVLYSCKGECPSALTVKEGTVRITDRALYNYDTLKTLAIPDSVTSIGVWAFYDCNALESVTIGNGVITIGEKAFYNCTKLKTITLGKNVSTIGPAAFYYCDNITDVHYNGFKNDRNSISIRENNVAFTGATWHYKYCGHSYTAICDEMCDVCGEVRVVEHDYQWVIDKENNCGQKGMKHEQCTRCASERNKNTTIPETGEHIYAAATCTAPKTCTVCGVTEGVPLAHDCYAATCTEPEFCKDCGAIESPALGHDYKAATCTSPASCNRCGKTIGTALGHDYVDATCTTRKTCNACGATEGEALGHNYAAANCTTPETCDRCGATQGSALGHDYAAATCTAPKTCTICHVTQGAALGHNYADATCTAPKTCKVCSATEGEALGHNYAAATCTAPKTCTICHATEGEALGHNYAAANCTTPETCDRCGATQGSALGHDYAAATCTAPKTCTICHVTQGAALGHNYADATCTAPKTCKVCSTTEGAALGHDYAAATCTEPKTCKVCSATEGEAWGHDYADATCTEPKTCKVCSATEGAALGHDFADATCTAPKTCKVCSTTEGAALGHDYADATCYVPKTCKVCGVTVGAALTHLYDDLCDAGCNLCGYIRDPIHDYEWIIDEKNTCGSDGVQHEECALCHVKRNEGTKILATGNHEFTDDNDTQCDVCQQGFFFIKFDSKNGSVVTFIRVGQNQSVALPSAVPERSGYNFAGWSTEKNGDIQYQPGETIAATKTTVLYAQWNKICPTCGGDKKFDCASCSGTGTIKEVCSYCDGKGYVVVGSNHISICEPYVYYKCSSCSGYGYKVCRICDENGEVIRQSVSAPGIPVLVSVNATTVVLRSITNGEYSIDGINWQEDSCFENLEAGKEYCFYQRYKKTDTAHRSASSKALTVLVHNHIFSNDCDWLCNFCEYTRSVPDHIYDNDCDAVCNECGEKRSVPDHVYDNACDTSCNICEDVRSVPDHVYDGVCDPVCNVCDVARTVPDHTYDAEYDPLCNGCGYNRADNWGKTGDCHWYLVGTTLVISGNGAMENYYSAPWGTSITKVVVEDGVTTIGQWAFGGCNSLISVTIPDSVTAIGSYAFVNCTGLTSITIPDSVTSIGSSAFSGCRSLESMTIPFVGGSRKTEQDTYQYPLGYIFGTSSYTGATAITQKYYGYYSYSLTSATYYIPTGLKSVTVTDGNLLYGAFYNCGMLTSVTIGDGVAAIADCAFYNCYGLADVWYTGYAYDRNNIVIGASNDALYSALWHFTPCTEDHDYSVNGGHTCGKCIYSKKPNAPVVVSKTNNSVTLMLVEGMEYSTDGSLWQDSNVFANLAADTTYTFYQRVKASFTALVSKTSEGAMVTFKSAQAAPSAPIISSFTDTTITLVPIANGEYSYDGVNWQKNNVFTGLSAGTQYTFYQRFAETDTQEYSNSSAGTNLTTDKAKQTSVPAAPTVQSFTSSSITLTPVEGCEYSKNGTTWQDSNVFNYLSCGKEYTFYQRYKETATTYAGKSSEGLVTRTDKGTQSTPSAPTLFEKTHNSVTLYERSGYEYSRDGINWQSSNVFTGLIPETNYMFYQRRAETATHYASEASAYLVVKTEETPACVENPSLHEYDNGCDMDCNVCGAVRAVSHDFAPATCTAPKTCKVCGTTEGTVAEHNYADATCTAPKTCKACGDVVGKALGHDYKNATCTEPQTCKRCGNTVGEALGHNYTIPNHDEKTHWMECSCGAIDEENRYGHGYTRMYDDQQHWLECFCGEMIDVEPHDYAAATYTAPKTCKVCGDTVGEPLSISISQQPQSVSVADGKTATISVTAIGEGLKYQWYYSWEGKFLACSGTGKSSYSITMNESRAGRQMYCVITDKYGNKVQSDTVTLGMKITITKQPVSVNALNGKTVSFSVAATGAGLKYQWYYSWEGDFLACSGTGKSSYSITMTPERAGRQMYCVITDKFGNSVQTNTVTMYIGAMITQQPKTVPVKNGEKATISLTAIGEGLKYQWYYKYNGKFVKSSDVGQPTYSITMNKDRAGRQMYCVITDKFGNSVKSSTVTLGMAVSISKQPVSVTVANGKTATVSVSATGEGLKYQWYYSWEGKFLACSGTGKSSYSIAMNESRAGRQMYCVITDKYGNKVRTDTVTLGMTFAITKQPTSTSAALGKSAKVSVTATGAGLKYQWYYSWEGEFLACSGTGKSSYSITMTEERAGRQMYCVITDKFGNSIQSNTVTLYKGP